MDAAVKQRVQKQLEEFIADPSRFFERFSHTAYLCRVATELNALPLLLDVGGCYALRPSGEIISVEWDDITTVQIETDARICNTVLFQGSKTYSGLGILKPERTPDAVECSACNGTGIPEMARELGITNLRCYCGGPGWVPAGTDTDAVAMK